MIYLGIDIGLTGAIAAIGPRGAEVYDIPTVTDALGHRLEGFELHRLLLRIVDPRDTGAAMFENVRVMPMLGDRRTRAATEGSLMRSRGTIEAALAIARIPFSHVEPQTWKRAYGLGGKEAKAQARETAVRLFPECAEQLKRVRDHNRAEALLIAKHLQGRLE